MPDVRIIPFKAEHYLALLEQADVGPLAKSKAFVQELEANEGYAYTALAGETVIGCGGVKPFWPGVGEAWAVYPNDRKEYAMAIAKQTRLGLMFLMQEHKLRRVQAVVPVTYAVGMRFVRWLGFEMEGRMRGYMPDGGDAYMYALATGRDDHA